MIKHLSSLMAAALASAPAMSVRPGLEGMPRPSPKAGRQPSQTKRGPGRRHKQGRKP